MDRDDPTTWPFEARLIAHDVATTADRSTAVVGGLSAFRPAQVGVIEATELPQGLRGSARAAALAEVDRAHGCNALIVADLSNDASYVEALSHAFGPRVLGVHIGPSGDGSTFTRVPAPHGAMLKYSIGRTFLIELLLARLENGEVRLADTPQIKTAFAQLADLEVVVTAAGSRIYRTRPGRHDDLGVSLGLIVWAARHPHLPQWVRLASRSRESARSKPAPPAAAWT